MNAGTAPARRRLPAWSLLVAAALASGSVIVLDRLFDSPAVESEAVPLDPAELRPGFGAKTHREAVNRADQGVIAMRYRLDKHPGDWLHMEGVARALVARYRLTGSYADLAEADRLLDQAISLAPWPAGPALSRASVALTLHKLQAAEAGLARFDAFVVPAAAEEQNEARSIRCEIAFQRGHIRTAAELCGKDQKLGMRLRQANIAAKRGDTADAARIVESLLRKPGMSPSTLAMLALQRASIALARGDWVASGRWSRAADRIFPGYWLSEAFVAQQYALEGKRDEAYRRFAGIARRTRNPDVMDALAKLAEVQGRPDVASAWAAQAGVVWDERMRLLPLATATHYAEYVLAHGDSQAALDLARAEYLRRPFSTPIANYARALLHNGQPAGALDVLRSGFARGWQTAAMRLEESQALRALGRGNEADRALRTARALNPHIADPRQQLVFFDQD
jgi:hypothetical protein